MILPKLFIGPMTKNVVDSVIEYANEHNVKIGLIPSRRQIEFNGGYVNKWKTEDFCNYVKKNTKNVLLVRDHCGPEQGSKSDDGIESFIVDCNFFDVIHIDVWKKNQSYDSGLKSTIEFIRKGIEINENILFEILTEESIRKFEDFEIEKFLYDLKKELSDFEFGKIIYCVIQSGTSLKGINNTGTYNSNRLLKMLEVTKKFKKISKEHNGDYLSDDVLKEKFILGLESINVAPEFGQIETNVILDEMSKINSELIDDFFEICLLSKKWEKWVDSNFNPYDNKLNLIKICGHYVLSDEKFLKLKKLLPSDIDDKIKIKIKDKINSMIDATNFDFKNQLKKYFEYFSNKDIKNLRKIFSNDVILKDWEIYSVGIDDVINENQKIFDSVESINVELIDIYKIHEKNKFSCEIKITVNQNTVLNVIDIIEFDCYGKIKLVQAFKQ